MKLLRQYIRKLIIESAIHPKINNQLKRIQDQNLVVSAGFNTFSGDWAAVTVDIQENNPESDSPTYIAQLQANADRKQRGNCNDALVISSQGVFAKKDLGPLVYDIAFELAELAGFDGLGPDPREVSSEAKAVWDYYLNKRNDVVAKQRDFFEAPVTDTKLDDCYGQDAAADAFPGGRTAAYKKTRHIKAVTFDDPAEGYTVPEEYSRDFIEFYFDPSYSLSKTYHKKNKGTPIINFLRDNMLLHPFSAVRLNMPYRFDEVKKMLITTPNMYQMYFNERKYTKRGWQKINFTEEQVDKWIMDNWVNPKK